MKREGSAPASTIGLVAEAEQRREARQRTSRLQEGMVKQLVSGSTALDVSTQTNGQEALEVLGQRLGLLKRRRAVGGDQVQRLERLFIQVRRLVLNHLNGHDA